MERISITMKERDEALHKVVTLKRQNDELLENTVHLEDQVSNQKKRSRGLEEQLKKFEMKIISYVKLCGCNFHRFLSYSKIVGT